jgi:hypothetical protein
LQLCFSRLPSFIRYGRFSGAEALRSKLKDVDVRMTSHPEDVDLAVFEDFRRFRWLLDDNDSATATQWVRKVLALQEAREAACEEEEEEIVDDDGRHQDETMEGEPADDDAAGEAPRMSGSTDDEHEPKEDEVKQDQIVVVLAEMAQQSDHDGAAKASEPELAEPPRSSLGDGVGSECVTAAQAAHTSSENAYEEPAAQDAQATAKDMPKAKSKPKAKAAGKTPLAQPAKGKAKAATKAGGLGRFFQQ